MSSSEWWVVVPINYTRGIPPRWFASESEARKLIQRLPVNELNVWYLCRVVASNAPGGAIPEPKPCFYGQRVGRAE